jgi:hypothetical protein
LESFIVCMPYKSMIFPKIPFPDYYCPAMPVLHHFVILF